MNVKQIVLSLIICSELVGCANRAVVVKQSPCPPEPSYPTIADKELDGVTNNTYVKLVDLISLRDEYINELKVYCNDRD